MGELAHSAILHHERDAKNGLHLTTTKMVDRILVVFDLEKDKSLYPKDWVVPGGTPISAALDFARTHMPSRSNPEIAAFSAVEKHFTWVHPPE